MVHVPHAFYRDNGEVRLQQFAQRLRRKFDYVFRLVNRSKSIVRHENQRAPSRLQASIVPLALLMSTGLVITTSIEYSTIPPTFLGAS